MKKLIYLLAVTFFYTSSVVAKTITSDVAQAVAVNFYKQNADVEVKTVSLAYTETSSKGDAVYFVFNIIPVGTPPRGTNTGGFVIIVADDALFPVIGYSTEGSFVAPPPLSNFSFWMEQRKSEIIADRMSRTYGIQTPTEISAQWTALLNNQPFASRSTSAVLPLLQTTWAQHAPYNALCPGGSLAGCVATTMSQIMRYWKYPAHGTGSSSYSSTYGTLSASYANTTYNWNNMPANVTSVNNDVSTIMYQCGISVEMIYSPGASSSACTIDDNPACCAQISFPKYFGYDSTTIKDLLRSGYSDADWITLIESDLNAGQPLMYEAHDPIHGGHVWVCDGYNSTNMMHMNWGWGGQYNGYYSVNSLTTTNVFDFTYKEKVLVGIKPKNVTGIPSISPIISLYICPNPASTQLTIHTSSSNTGEATISIMNVLGQGIQSFGRSLSLSKGEAIDISNLPAGIYFLEMKTESAIDTKRFIKE